MPNDTRVLVVEDDAGISRFLKQTLMTNGYDVLPANRLYI